MLQLETSEVKLLSKAVLELVIEYKRLGETLYSFLISWNLHKPCP